MICRFCELRLVIIGFEEFSFGYCPKCRLMYFRNVKPPTDMPGQTPGEVSEVNLKEKKEEHEALAGLASLFG